MEEEATTPTGLVRPHGHLPPVPGAPQKPPRPPRSDAAHQPPGKRLAFSAQLEAALLMGGGPRPASAGSPRVAAAGGALPARLLR